MWIAGKKEICQLLELWYGADAQVWEYVCGHGTLLVRVFRPRSKLNLFIQCKDCRTIKFSSMGWKDANFTLREKPNPLQNEDDFKFEIQDGSRFYAACWGLYLLESEKPIFIDWPIESRKSSESRTLI
jgi:hypothetical protein